MNEPIKCGDDCIVVGGLGRQKSPNLGKRVKVLSSQGEHSQQDPAAVQPGEGLRWVEPMSPQPILTISVADISTAHLPSDSAIDEADLLAAPYEYGWFLYMESEATGGRPEWYEAIRQWAKALGYDWIRLDADGNEVEGLPTYQWESFKNLPKCACCGTTENLHEDLGSGGPYRCNSPDCVVF